MICGILRPHARQLAGRIVDSSAVGEYNEAAEWRELYAAAQLRDVEFETMSGLALEPVYGPPGSPLPGLYPYTRGPYASMYRSKLWTMRMFAGFGTARRHQRPLPRVAPLWRRRLIGCLRPADIDGPGLR